MFYIMRLVDLKKTDAFLAVEEQLPKVFTWAKYVAFIKHKGDSTSISKTFYLAIVFAIFCIAFGALQSILSLYFWGWFGVNRLTAMYIMSLGLMVSIFSLVSYVASYIRGMSRSIDKSLSNAKYFIVTCIILCFLSFTFHKADDYALLMTLELLSVLVGLFSVFVEFGFDRTKINSEQYKELLEVRSLNLRLMKLKKKIDPSNNVMFKNIDELYGKSSEIEDKLKSYFSN